MKYSYLSNSEKETNCHVHATLWVWKWPTIQTKECVLVELIVGLQFLQSLCPTNHFFNGVIMLSCLFKASIRRRDEANVIVQVFNALCVYSVTQLCPTLCDPMNCSPPRSSVHGILQARILEWVAISHFRGSSQPREWTQVSCIAGRFSFCFSCRQILYWLSHQGSPSLKREPPNFLQIVKAVHETAKVLALWLPLSSLQF